MTYPNIHPRFECHCPPPTHSRPCVPRNCRRINSRRSSARRSALRDLAPAGRSHTTGPSLSTLPTSRTRHGTSVSAQAPVRSAVIIGIAVAGVAPVWRITTPAVAICAYSRGRPDQCEPNKDSGGLLLLSDHLLTFQHAHPASVHFRHELELKRRILRLQGRFAKRGFAYGRWLFVELCGRRRTARQRKRNCHGAEASS